MESRFNFNNLQYFTLNNFDHDVHDASNLKESLTNNTAADDEELMLELPFYQKSNQNLTQAYEISFQNNFMSEHSSVFQRQLQNYMESVRIHLQKTDQKVLQRFPEGLYNLKTNMTCEELIMMAGIELSTQMKNKFLDDLKFYDKLSEFLNVVADQCPAEIAVELIQIAQQILEEFLASEHKDNVHVDSSVLLEIASNKAKNLKNINLLNLRVISTQSSKNDELMTKYQKFIEIYCATTILVIAQFFENPYNAEEELKGFKRSFNSYSSEEDDETEEKVETTLQKKRKFSF